MSNLIATDLRRLEVRSDLIDLFSLELPNGNNLYFHPGLNENLASITFRDAESPYEVRTYEPFPVEIEGMELSADGAAKRPTLTIANIGLNFNSILQGYEIKDLIGQRITRRQTLRKYLADESTATPPIEMTNMTYIIDRISAETSTSISFEVAVVYDLEGIKLPRRVAVGKFCSWMYQGAELHEKGGCTWKADSSVTSVGGANYEDTLNHNFYFDLEDKPFISKSYVDAEVDNYNAQTSYTTGTIVKTTADGKYWMSLFGLNVGNTPSLTSEYWKEARIYEPHTFTEDSCDTVDGDATVTHTANSSIVNGIFVSGPGIPEGATVTSAASGTFELSSAATEDGTNITLTFVKDKTYAVGDLVEASTTVEGKELKTVWFCTKAHNSKTTGTIPFLKSKYWRREELCGKTLQSCKCRFQSRPNQIGFTQAEFESNRPPLVNFLLGSSISLPFGAFIGTERL